MQEILRVLPRQRSTMLFSATMNKSVKSLKTTLTNPVNIQVNKLNELNLNLQQFMYCCKSESKKLAHLVSFLLDMDAKDDVNKTFIIFCNTVRTALTVHVTLKHLSFQSVPIYGKMAKNKRLGALLKFKKHKRNIMVATDVA